MSIEQENHILDQIRGRQLPNKLQSSSDNRNLVKPMVTPKETLKSLKPNVGKSSRKAFGNVSNVLRSGTQSSIPTKSQIKVKPSVKETVDTKSVPQKVVVNPLVTSSSSDDSKFFDEIEEMFPNRKELMSDELDPMTRGMFELEDKVAMNMEWDEDMDETLVPRNKLFDLNELF